MIKDTKKYRDIDIERISQRKLPKGWNRGWCQGGKAGREDKQCKEQFPSNPFKSSTTIGLM